MLCHFLHFLEIHVLRVTAPEIMHQFTDIGIALKAAVYIQDMLSNIEEWIGSCTAHPGIPHPQSYYNAGVMKLSMSKSEPQGMERQLAALTTKISGAGQSP